MPQIKAKNPDKVQVQVLPAPKERRVAAPSAAKLAFVREKTNNDPTWQRD